MAWQESLTASLSSALSNRGYWLDSQIGGAVCRQFVLSNDRYLPRSKQQQAKGRVSLSRLAPQDLSSH
ncbi:hypothetical protein E2C01_044453 [Portunus trituberculatus]|uniref:Uncharacterized protein n=1 Tax=Portunus trituberculatus TaxID=210409 RepID=A0A5B7FZA7_PORTR|nr:hypothetical protein [Portunus trituberculatus]